MSQKKKYVIIAALMIILISLLCMILSLKGNQSQITIAIPQKVLRIAAHSAEEEIAELKFIGGENWSDIEVSEDGRVIITLSKMQASKWLDNIERTMSYLQTGLKEYDSDSKLLVSRDYTQIDLYIKREMSIPDISNYLLNAEALCARYQIFSGTAPDDWYTEINIYNARTEKLVVSCSSNETLIFYEEDWDASE